MKAQEGTQTFSFRESLSMIDFKRLRLVPWDVWLVWTAPFVVIGTWGSVMARDGLGFETLMFSVGTIGMMFYATFSEYSSDSPFWTKFNFWLLPFEKRRKVVQKPFFQDDGALCCERCGGALTVLKAHLTFAKHYELDEKEGGSVIGACEPLCRVCWVELSQEERKPYYKVWLNKRQDEVLRSPKARETEWQAVKEAVEEGR